MYKIDPGTSISNVELVVSALDRSVKFYSEIMGFTVLKEEKNVAYLGPKDGNTILILREESGVSNKPPQGTGLYHFAILLPNRSDLGSWLSHIVAHKYPLIGGSDHQFSEAIYLSDPDGIGIEIYADRLRDTWETEDNLLHNVGNYALDAEGLMDVGAKKKWDGLTAGTTIGHIHLHVHNIDLAKNFYENILGFNRKMLMSGSMLFIAAGTYHHHIGFNTWGGGDDQPLSPHVAGMTSFTLELPNEESLNQLLDQLRDSGENVQHETDQYFLIDPFGFKLLMTY